MFPIKYFVVIVLLISGCTTYHGLEPVSPSYTATTAEVRPEFKWKPSEIEGVHYDFIIYELERKGNVTVPGRTVYYKEDLSAPEYVVETDLIPGKRYLWTVRVRQGDNVEQWSRYDYTAYYVFGYVQKWNHFYEIRIAESKSKS